MSISITPSPINFQSRNPYVKKADDIARLSKHLFPAVSSSNIKRRAKGNEYFNNLIRKIGKKIGENVRCHSSQPDSLARAMLIASTIKKFKVGNCAEISRVANLICKVNNMNTLPFQFLVERNGRLQEVDHMALIFPLKQLPETPTKLSKCKDVIIIDPWLGFADFAPKMQEKYNKDYSHLLDISANENLVISPQYLSHTDRLFNKDAELLKEKFPYWFKSFSLQK